MYNKDKDHISEYDKELREINQKANLKKGQKEMCKNRDLEYTCRYHNIVCVQGVVLDHLRECYTIRYNEAIRTKE